MQWKQLQISSEMNGDSEGNLPTLLNQLPPPSVCIMIPVLNLLSCAPDKYPEIKNKNNTLPKIIQTKAKHLSIKARLRQANLRWKLKLNWSENFFFFISMVRFRPAVTKVRNKYPPDDTKLRKHKVSKSKNSPSEFLWLIPGCYCCSFRNL